MSKSAMFSLLVEFSYHHVYSWDCVTPRGHCPARCICCPENIWYL